jgi:hypothetical protein
MLDTRWPMGVQYKSPAQNPPVNVVSLATRADEIGDAQP